MRICSEITACFTGHRMIAAEAVPSLLASLDRIIQKLYRIGYRCFLCGAALGFDTLAAERVLALMERYPGLRLILVIPCRDQSSRWSSPDRERYARLLEQVPREDQILLSDRYYPGCMMVRNMYMVDHSSCCICYMNRMQGGTLQTVRYASRPERSVPVINLAVQGSDDFSIRMEEPARCSYISTSPSASESAFTVISHPIHRKTNSWSRMYRCSSVKLHCGKKVFRPGWTRFI